MARLSDPVLKWARRPFEEATGGVHTDIFRASILMLESGHPDDVIFSFLRSAANMVTDRRIPDREIHSAIRYAHHRKAGTHVSYKWPKFVSEYRNEIVAAYPNLISQLSESAAQLEQHPRPYLERLYQPTDLVCVAMSSESFLTLPRDEVANADNVNDVEYINPSPMCAPFGLTQDNRVSAHCLANTGAKVYQVIEFDFGLPHEHAAILWHLGRKLPLVMAVYSGGKSLHGWFNVRGLPDEVVQTFFAEAVSLGADPKMWSKSQFSRIPAGTNHAHQRQQTVVFFNPSLLS